MWHLENDTVGETGTKRKRQNRLEDTENRLEDTDLAHWEKCVKNDTDLGEKLAHKENELGRETDTLRD